MKGDLLAASGKKCTIPVINYLVLLSIISFIYSISLLIISFYYLLSILNYLVPTFPIRCFLTASGKEGH